MFNRRGPTLGATLSHLGSMFFKKEMFDLFVATKQWLSECLEDHQVLAEQVIYTTILLNPKMSQCDGNESIMVALQLWGQEVKC